MTDVGRFIGASILLFCSCSLSAAAGIGGGGVNVPILIVVYGYSFDRSVVFSSCTLLGNFISQIFVNFPKHHPKLNTRPLIYVDLVLVLLPAQLGGSRVGSVLSKVLPTSVLYVLALCVLLFAAVMTTQKGLKLRHKELSELDRESSFTRTTRPPKRDQFSGNSGNSGISRSQSLWDRLTAAKSDQNIPPRVQAVELLNSPSTMRSPVLSADNVENPIVEEATNSAFLGLVNGSGPSSTSVPEPSRDPVMSTEKSLESGPTETTKAPEGSDKPPPRVEYPWSTIAIIIGMWSLFVIILVVSDSYHPCTVGNSVSFVMMYVPLLCGAALGVYRAALMQNKNPLSILEGDLHFKDYDIKPVLFVFAVGMLCSMLGIGGGELIGPLLLSLGVLAQVSSATTSSMSFFNTFSILINKAVEGKIDYNIGPILLVIGLCGGFVGRNLGIWFADTYKRPSMLIFSLVGILVLSLIFYIYELSGGELTFGVVNYCST